MARDDNPKCEHVVKGELEVTARFVVKRRRIIGGVEGTTVVSRPLSQEEARAHLDELNELYQTPGNYYIEEWRDAS